MQHTLTACIQVLKLQKPVKVIVHTAIGRSKDCGNSRIVVGKKGIRHHVINLYLPTIEKSNYSLNGILAHELIHAWQFENQKGYCDPDRKVAHGKKFAILATNLRDKLEYVMGVKIPMNELYNPETDKP